MIRRLVLLALLGACRTEPPATEIVVTVDTTFGVPCTIDALHIEAACDGRVKMIDFGIAKARGRLGETRSGSGLKGKLRYMPPEQAWGRPIDRRADIYALGVCLWELLAGRRLFRGKNDLAVLELVRNPVIPPPSQLNPEVSAALDAVVLRATALRPEDRHQTALELRRDLMAAVPDAIAIPPELVGEFVHDVRGPDHAGTFEGTATLADLTESPSPLPGSSFPASAGELQPRPWRTRGLIAFGLVAACAIGIVIATARDPGDARTPAASAAQALGPDAGLAAALTSDAAIAALPAVDASVAPATAPAPVAMPAVPAPPALGPPPPRRAPHPAVADKAHATPIEADGAVLADEPAPPTDKPAARPRPRPAKTVRADDAVLAQ